MHRIIADMQPSAEQRIAIDRLGRRCGVCALRIFGSVAVGLAHEDGDVGQETPLRSASADRPSVEQAPAAALA